MVRAVVLTSVVALLAACTREPQPPAPEPEPAATPAPEPAAEQPAPEPEPEPEPPTDGAVLDALARAIADQRESLAYYRAVIAKHDAFAPFGHVSVQTNREADKFGALLEARGGEMPADTTDAGGIEVPITREQASKAAIDRMRLSIELYDELIAQAAADPEVVSELRRVRTKMEERLLPMFALPAAGGRRGPPRGAVAPGGG